MSEIWNHATKCFVTPPDPEYPARSWTAVVYVEDHPGQVFSGRRTLPGKIQPMKPVMDDILSDPDRIQAIVAQVSEEEQYVCIQGESRMLIFKLTNMEVEVTQAPKTKEGCFLLNLFFAMHEEQDEAAIARAMVAAALKQ